MTTDTHPFDRLTGRAILLASLVGGLVPTVLAFLLVRGDLERATSVAALAGYLGVVVVLALLARASGVSLERLLGRMPTGREVLVAVGLGIVLLTFSFGVVIVIAGALSFVVPSLVDAWRSGPSMDVLVWEDGRLDVLASGLFALSAAIVAPVVEELVFRGFLLTRWIRRFGVRAGVVGTALLFGLLHFALQPIGAFALGLVAAVLYLRTRSLLLPMLVHATSNGTIVLLLFLAGEPEQAQRGPTNPDELRSVIVWGAALVAVSAPLVALALKAWWPSSDATLPYDDDAPRPDDDAGSLGGVPAAAADGAP